MKILKTRSSAQAGAGLAMRVEFRNQRLFAIPKKVEIARRLAVPTKDGITIIPLDQITFIKAESNYSVIHTLTGSRHLVSKPLKQFDDRLQARQFARCHQSYLVNCIHVSHLITGTHPRVVLSTNMKIPVSRRQIATFKNYLLNQYSI